MKKILTLILALCLALSLWACGATEDKILGAWQRETMYLDSYGCDADMMVCFVENGDYIKILANHATGELLNLEFGTWEIDGGEVVATENDGIGGSAHYKYAFGKLTNGGNKYTRNQEATAIFDSVLG